MAHTSAKRPDPTGDAEQRLLAGARDAFAVRGYHGTSTREIAASAGMSPAAMYIHFRSKQEILARLSVAGHAAALAALKRGADASGTAQKRLRAAVYEFAYWHAENHTTGRVVQYELESLDDAHRSEVVQLRHDVVVTMRDIVAEGSRAGEFSVSDIDVTTLAILSLCIDTVRWYPSRELHDPESVGASFAVLVERMVGAVTG